jgi:hypothetical protein
MAHFLHRLPVCGTIEVKDATTLGNMIASLGVTGGNSILVFLAHLVRLHLVFSTTLQAHPVSIFRAGLSIGLLLILVELEKLGIGLCLIHHGDDTLSIALFARDIVIPTEIGFLKVRILGEVPMGQAVTINVPIDVLASPLAGRANLELGRKCNLELHLFLTRDIRDWLVLSRHEEKDFRVRLGRKIHHELDILLTHNILRRA